MKSYFLFYKDVDDYGYFSAEFETEDEVLEFLDDNPYEDIKLICGESLKVVQKYEVEKN